MIISLPVAFLLPILSGAVALWVLWPEERSRRADIWLIGALAAGLGLGIASAAYFVWLMLFGSSRMFIAIEVISFAMLTGAALQVARRRLAATDLASGGEPTQTSLASRLPLAGFVLVLLATLTSFLAVSATYPHSRWDAITIWNMRARFLFRGADQWSDAFSGLLGNWTHADYPLLLPASIARGWSFVGSDTTAVPVLVAGLFTFATAWLLLASLSSLRSRGQGLVAAAVVLGWHQLVMQGTWQYADVPLAFFILASVVAIALAGTVTDGRGRFLVLAGIMAGLAAWTKNEGLLFLLAFFVAQFAVTARRRGWRTSLRDTGSMLAGLAPILTLVVWFKWGIAPSNDLIASLDLSTTLGRLTDVSRYGTVLAGFALRLSVLGGWLVSAPLALALYMLAVGVRLGERERPAVATAALAIGLLLVGYFFVFVITPHDLGWHVATSLHRLLLHAWPSLLFVFFLFAREPEEALTSSVPQGTR